jgi:putative ABC transport system permease protein
VVAFGFMVRTAVLRGQDGASWQTTGADAVISMVTTAPLTPAGQHAIAAVPGARHTAAALVTAGTPGSGPPVTVVLVSPAGYAALVAETPYPRVKPALLAEPAGGAAPGTPGPALASPAAAAELAHRAVALSTDLGTLRVRVAGRLSSTPAVPGTGSFVVLPFWAASHLSAPKSPTELLVTGPQLDDQALTATAARVVPGATITFRARVLASLAGAALPHGAYVAFAEGSGVAAGFCVLVLMLSLVLAARSRALTLARLSTMGLGTGQGRLLVIAEAMPQVLAAAVAGAACALALVPLLGPVLDLSVFTGSAAAVPVRADLVALAIPAAGLIILAVATLSAQAIAASRRGAASALRISG